MNIRRLTPLAIICITILSADLLAEVIVLWAQHWLKSSDPYRTTAISMVAAVLVFYPTFQLVDKVVKKFAGKYVGKTKQAVGGGVMGLLVAFLLALAILFMLYLNVKYNINLLERIL
jgi:ABC-type anion transport system duplicated permease subunit